MSDTCKTGNTNLKYVSIPIDMKHNFSKLIFKNMCFILVVYQIAKSITNTSNT